MMNDPLLTPDTAARADGFVPFSELTKLQQDTVAECHSNFLEDIGLDHRELWWLYGRNTLGTFGAWGCRRVLA